MITYITFLILVASASADPTEAAPKNCIVGNNAVMDAFRKTETCFREIVQEQIGNKSSNHFCRTLQDFNKTFENFRFQAIDSCILENQILWKERRLHLFNLVEFSLNGNSFRNFYNDNGIESVNKFKNELVECVKETTGVSDDDIIKTNKHRNPKYWLNLNRPKFTKNGCEDASIIKACIIEKFTNKNAEYITGIFDHLIKVCKNITEPKNN